MERRLAAILAADVVGYSRLMAADEAGTVRRLSALRRERVDPLIAAHRGRVVKLMGDGTLVEFASVVDAVQCAVELQAALAEHNALLPEPQRLVLRIGINLGDVIVEGSDLYGDGVNVAARIEPLAEPGGVAVSQTVRDHVGNKLGLAFADLGERRLKNIDRPVRVWAVRAGAMPESTLPPVDATRPSIAVLPFANMSGDPEQDYFGDGIAEDIITDLSKISALFVLSRNSSFAHRGQAVDIAAVCCQHGIAYVLEGSVRKVGSRVRITAQLIDGSTGGHLWAERYDRDLTDIFAVQDEITRQIVTALKVRLLPREKAAISGGTTDSVEAYQHYLQGRQFFHRHNRRALVIARRKFEEAIAADPQFARAYAAIADTEALLYLWHDPGVSPDSILAASARALELRADLAEAHASRGLALEIKQQFEEAEQAFRRAIELDPNLFEAFYFFARMRVLQGRREEAVELFRHAAELRSDDFQALALLPQMLRALGRTGEIAATAREARDRAARELGRNPENARAAYMKGLMEAELGDAVAARRQLAEALAMEPDDFTTLYNVACGFALLGDTEEAITLLERTEAGISATHRTWLMQDSDLDPLRDHPRFRALLARLGL
ncbi:MAG: adenylate/guanylate cyclase domain-containing protein [Geminicoccaceae bacterium]